MPRVSIQNGHPDGESQLSCNSAITRHVCGLMTFAVLGIYCAWPLSHQISQPKVCCRETRANFGSVSGLSGFRTWKSLMGKDTRIGSISCTGPQRALVPSDAPQSGRLPRFPATRSMCWRTTRTTQLCWSESRTSKDQSHFEQAASKPPGEGSSHCLQRTLLSCL